MKIGVPIQEYQSGNYLTCTRLTAECFVVENGMVTDKSNRIWLSDGPEFEKAVLFFKEQLREESERKREESKESRRKLFEDLKKEFEA